MGVGRMPDAVVFGNDRGSEDVGNHGHCRSRESVGQVGLPAIPKRRHGAVGTGISDIDETTELFNKLARSSIIEAGKGSGPWYGTRVHLIFARKIRALNRDDLKAEVSYLDGEISDYGKNGTIRTDVVYGSNLEAPKAICDLKTGGARMSKRQYENYKNQFTNSPFIFGIFETY